MRWITGVGTMAMAVAGLLLPPPAAAQRVEDYDLPASVADEIIAFFNAPGTERLDGPATIGAGEVRDTDVGVLGGPVTVRGHITRDLVVVNGDVRIEEGGRVDGDVTVIGGRVTAPPGTVGGRLTVYEQILTYTRRGERIVYERPRRRDRTWRYDQPSWRATIAVDIEDAYNRVEGLPLRIGPVLESRGANSTRVEALAVWRSVNGFSTEPEDFGWLLRFQQGFGDDKVAVGATRHSLVRPIERSGLSDLEASLSAGLFRRDLRDWYEADGFEVYGRYADRGEGLRVVGGYRDETHAFVPVGDPWTLWNDDDPWRPQPVVGQGDLRSVFGEMTFDRRNDAEDPTDGWLLAARLEGGLEGTLTRPRLGGLAPAQENVEFRSGALDLRRYMRLGPSADLRLRGVVAGSLDGEPLPPQRQHALGGEGTLPGYPALSIDCGARNVLFGSAAVGSPEAVFGAYGCDRVALFQVEYRSSFSIDLDFGDDWDDEDDWNDDWEDWDWRPAFDATPRWAVFADVGQGWALDGPGPARSDTGVFADVGAGLFIGGLGLYWAVPLHGDDHGVNFFLRLDHRF